MPRKLFITRTSLKHFSDTVGPSTHVFSASARRLSPLRYPYTSGDGKVQEQFPWTDGQVIKYTDKCTLKDQVYTRVS